MLLLALLAATQAPPDIAIDVHATVREVRVRQRGETSLQVRASPDANSRVTVSHPDAEAQRRARGATVDVHAEARIADPATNLSPPETPRPEPR